MKTLPDFVEGVQVNSEENGGTILFATDDFFAVAENLLKSEEPVWREDYTEFGKWMDGWETRRKRIAGHDWAIIALGKPSILSSICVDTAFFTGNYAPRFSLQGACLFHTAKGIQNRRNKMGSAATVEDLEKASELQSENWETIIPMTSLKSGNLDTRNHFFELDTGDRVYTHLRLNIFPDGGVARLRVYGENSKSLPNNRLHMMQPLRGKCVEFSNAHFGHPDTLLVPGPPKGMHDAWETARRLDRPPEIQVDDSGFMQINGEEWATLLLEKAVYVHYIEVDTRFFKGNCPDNVKIEGTYLEPGQDLKSASWDIILNRTKLMPNQSNGLKHPFIELINRPINHVKVIIAPDGGIARVRIYGSDCDSLKQHKPDD
ncbi:probable allantoicase isoform X1 [Nasonia vitripennis]|uniref:Allantoate amidinohydrolase n=2 Tax=Nasonia vitripennis TaxID=7425 RepID=A0A7M7G6D7_NASVI|nr:probable allantoicase isoform X1 [Nasonia vitripennis]